MHRRLQFDMRENPASDRRHGSRPVVDSHSNEHCIAETQRSPQHTTADNHLSSGANKIPNAASLHASTGERRGDESLLLTVHEVAELLRVPVSWVYGRMRKRSPERLPAYRLGKYWRFREDEVLRWVEGKGGDGRAA
jgi:excisionase family DNA binding protein